MRHLLTLGAVLLLSGCGSYQIGKANQGQQDGGDPGGGSNGTGGSQNGTGGSSGGGAIGKGGAMGGGGAVGGGTGQCDPAGCAVPAVCQVCPDGSYSCAKADCIDGKCQTIFEPCGGGGVGGAPGVECVANTDCVQAGAPCQVCPDGSTACPKVECVGGKCVGSFPGCGGGACDPGLCPVPPPNAKACCISTSGPCGVDFLDGICVPTPKPGGCASDLDCPVLASCQVCPDGSCAPVSATCESGQCITHYGTCGGGTDKLNWYMTCGDPVCRGPGAGGTSSGYPPCDPAAGQKVTGPCDKAGQICDPGGSCGEKLMCATSDPTHGGNCPISRAKFKTDIEYVSPDERVKLAEDVQTIPLVRYRYKDAPERAHLGFIIEDIEPSPSVDSKHDRVDLYGYTSMAVAAIQEQKKAIDALKHEVAELRAELARRSGK